MIGVGPALWAGGALLTLPGLLAIPGVSDAVEKGTGAALAGVFGEKQITRVDPEQGFAEVRLPDGQTKIEPLTDEHARRLNYDSLNDLMAARDRGRTASMRKGLIELYEKQGNREHGLKTRELDILENTGNLNAAVQREQIEAGRDAVRTQTDGLVDVAGIHAGTQKYGAELQLKGIDRQSDAVENVANTNAGVQRLAHENQLAGVRDTNDTTETIARINAQSGAYAQELQAALGQRALDVRAQETRARDRMDFYRAIAEGTALMAGGLARRA